MKTTKPYQLHLSLITALALAGPASAATLTYNGTDGNWDTDANWTGGPEPVSGDLARVLSGETVTVDQAGEIAGQLQVSNSGSTVIVTTGGALTLNAVTQTASLNIGSNGILNVNGGSVTVLGVVNNFLNGGGQVNVSAGSLTHTATNLRFGDGASTGTIDVSGSGTWSSGNLNIIGTGNINLTGSSATISGVNINNNFGGNLTFNLTPDSGLINAIAASTLNLTSADTLNVYTANLNYGDQAFDIFDYSSLTSTFDTVNIFNPTFGNLTLGSDPFGDASNLNAGEYWIDYGGGSNDSITLLYAIPEPSSTALLGLGGLAFALRRRR